MGLAYASYSNSCFGSKYLVLLIELFVAPCLWIQVGGKVRLSLKDLHFSIGRVRFF